ncbi:hypothetical protein [Algoriphagus sediminis]|uniref:Uncharacterized protein n=1 Tax=Algoriphagus sediminis TaxID=3057113 RepID=A0ABT7YBM7_9BACT|nr:hypothetical protein [Algoriphagus sediminis]MDN3203919.1 hypothetical protein [Algoriphagus sediminis]
MTNYKTVVGIVTGALIVFTTLIQFELSMFLIWLMFLISPFLVIWMVWSVLVAPVEIKETFDEQFYQDRKNTDL